MANKKSDIPAKRAFCGELLKRGYDTAEVVSSPADICATKNGEKWYFEIKMTRRQDVYFGAATQTEWEQAFHDPDHFRFVVVQLNEDDSVNAIHEFTPQEFMRGCTIPPFKVYFDVNMASSQIVDKTQAKRATPFTEDRFHLLYEAYKLLKK